MGFPTFENFRELLPPKVRLNADDLSAQMQGFLGREHHADGSHSDITADSIDTGPVTIVSDDWWISLVRENAVGNRTLLGRLTQAESAILLQVAGRDAMAWGVQPASGPGIEHQVHDGLTVLERLKLFGQGTVSADPPGVLQDDSTLGLRYSVYAVTATGARTVNGFATLNPTEGGRGQLLILWNASTFTITFAHDATATSFMRLICPGGANLVLPPLTASIWIYDVDPAVRRWRCIGGTFQGSGGGGTGGMNLDYLGNYVAGPVYNDGDIVVATDGIAYLCVVDGTTTPPEPWPGVGIATAVGPPGPEGPPGPPGPPGVNAAIDATYWTVSGHPGLTNERALNSLVNGYVKSTVGEPSTVAVIPITDGGTGGTTAPQARTNLGLGTMAVQNADNVAITGGTITASSLASTGGINASSNIATFGGFMLIQSPNPALYLIDDSTNTRWQQISGGGGTFFVNSYNADGTGGVVAVQLTRAGGLTIGTTLTTGSHITVGGGGNISLTGGVFAGFLVGDGSNVTNLNAGYLTAGVANPARLGTGTPNASTFLRGDGVWATTPGFPSGLIVLNDGPCPPGWSRVGWDGSFLRVNASAGGTGGAATHQHGAGTLAGNAHSHGGATGAVSVTISGTTSNDGTHTHPFGGHVGGTTAAGSGSVQTADAGGSFQVLTPPHTHDFGADFAGTTGSGGGHTHSFSGSGSGTGSIGSEGVGISGATAAQSSLPPYIDVVLCRKD